MHKNSSLTQYRSNLIIGGMLGLIFFLAIFGVKILDPTYIDWQFKIGGGDPILGVVGWHFFRFEDWHFPMIGYIKNYGAPIGTSAFMMTTSLLSIFFKIFKSFLPMNFQYVGIWILSCYVLQGFFASLLLQEINKNTFFNIVGALFFIASPIMLCRALAHFGLMSHWMILYALWLNINSTSHKKFLQWLILSSTAILVFVYMYAMVMILFLAYCLHQIFVTKNIKAKKVIKWFGLVLLVNLFLAWITGAFQPGFGGLQTGGFGYYSMNLLALVNPQWVSTIKDWSIYLPSYVKVGPGQYEGFNYLGLGMILLVIFTIIMGLMNITKIKHVIKKHWPLLLILLIVTVYALSEKITFGNKTLLNISWLYQYFTFITSTFRSSGRFFWPAYYALFFVSLWTANRYISQKYLIRYLILAIVLILQLTDFSEPFSFFNRMYTNHYKWSSDLQSSFWIKAVKKYKKIIFMPNEPNPPYYYEFALLAANNGMSISNGYFPRINGKKLHALSTSLQHNFISGELDGNALYIVTDLGILNLVKAKKILNYCMHDVNGYLAVTKRDPNNKDETCIPVKKPPKSWAFYELSPHLYCVGELAQSGFNPDAIHFYVKDNKIVKILATGQNQNQKLSFCHNKSVVEMMARSSKLITHQCLGWFYLDKRQECDIHIPNGYYQLLSNLPSNSTILFSDGGFFVNGWSPQEKEFRWNDGNMSTIVFMTNKDVRYTGELLLNYAAVLGEQKMILKLNGTRIYDKNVNGSGLLKIKFDKKLLRKNKINTLSFYFPRANPPGNGDKRVLALAFRSLQIQ